MEDVVMNSICNQKSLVFDQNFVRDPFFAEKVEGKTVSIDFDGGDLTSDAGALILKEIARENRIISKISQCITDPRDQNKVQHPLEDLILQRVSQIACGYEDANDSNILRTDPIFKILVGHSPYEGDPLASQPTFSRLENSIDKETNNKLEQTLIDHFIQSYPEPPEVIVVDADQTVDIVHGGQQERLFSDYYKEYCFLPLHIYEGLSGKLITTILMPGKRPTGPEMLTITQSLIEKLRAVWPKTLIIFRGDAHFAYPEVMEWIDRQENVMFIIGLSGNSRLLKQAESVIIEAQNKYKETKQDVCRFHSIYYQAGSWSRMRRVVVKVEVTAKGTNIRFVVTDMEQAKAHQLYQIVYCGRGVAELYIKDHKTYLKSDRTSCSDFEANRFRLLLHSAAYILLHDLRTHLLKSTQWANATMQTIRLKFLKIAARVKDLKTRIKVELPSSYPLKDVLRHFFQVMEVMRQTRAPAA